MERMKYILLSLAVLMSIPAFGASVTEQFELSPSPGGQAAYTATTTSTKILPVNKNRVYLMLQNQGAVVVDVKLGAIEASDGVQLQPGGSYEFVVGPTNSVWIKSASSTATVVVIEGNAQ
jgi:hypothetical protein